MKNLIVTIALTFASLICSGQNATRVVYGRMTGNTGDTVKIWIEVRRDDYKLYNNQSVQIGPERFGFIGTDSRYAYYWIIVANKRFESFYLKGSAGQTDGFQITNYNNTVVGLENEFIDSDIAFKKEYHTVNGQKIESPEQYSGLLIVTTYYSNGSVRSSKELRMLN